MSTKAASSPTTAPMPPRWNSGGLRSFVLTTVVILAVLTSLGTTGFSLDHLIRGLPRLGALARQMIPPDFSRLEPILWALLITAQIALAGTGLGLALSLPLGVLASRSQSPGLGIPVIVQSLLAAFRTIPELVWAILFVACFGPGAFAGVMAICVDTLGFAGRFFAGAIDECDPAPQEALRSLGAARWQIFLAAVWPATLPSFIQTSLYSLERALRASVVLGIVGAGGIGIELKVAMDLFEYRRAAAIIICILVVVLAVEFAGSLIRTRLLPPRSA